MQRRTLLILGGAAAASVAALPEHLLIDSHGWPRLALETQSALRFVYAAVMLGKPPLHSGEWGLATLEICLGILQSAGCGHEIGLDHQI